MTLATGTVLGRYALGPLLGAGGMGEVYRARDTQLDRDVAIKVLPPGFAASPDARRRFEQEARATAAINHPGVLAIYDAGTHDGRSYLVTEFLDGKSLRDRLGGQPLDLHIAVRYAIEVAAALAAAHAQGIVHRDIKPENLFVTRADAVKILDFGLARMAPPLSAGPPDSRQTYEGTLPNVVLGTLGYMAPEQARGQPADHRADIFSLGCVLFEMIEGQAPFARATPADTISAILSAPPAALSDAPAHPLPPALQPIVRRCLEKDPLARFQSASDLAFTLQSLTGVKSPDREDHAVQRPRARPRRITVAAGAAVALGVLGLTAAGVWFATGVPPRPRAEVIEFLVPPPASDARFAASPLRGLDPTVPQVGVSPDGRTIAFVAIDASGIRRLWTRALDSSTARSVDGADGVSSWPFWSPDSRFLAFAANAVLWKLDMKTRTLERLCSLPDQGVAEPFVTGSWGAVDVVFSIGPAGLYRVPATGGQAAPLTALDSTRHDNYHSWPQWLPDGRLLVFVRTEDVRTTGMYVRDQTAGKLTQVMTAASRAIYANGSLMWSMDGRLVAQPFDVRALRLSGQPATIVPAIFQGAGRTAAFWASDTGTLVYAFGGRGSRRQFRWVSRVGASIGEVGAAGNFASFDLSPDGARIVAEVRKEGSVPRSTLALIDASRMISSALTDGERNDTDPRFGPDGDVAFARNDGATPGVARLARAGMVPELIVPRGKAPVVWLEDWAGRHGGIVYRTALDRDAWQVADRSAPRRLTNAREPVEQIQLSPDGRWIAYNTADSGQPEVYVSPASGSGERWQISGAGGVQALWRGDGRELYYLGLDGAIYVVDIRLGSDTPEPTKPRLLFRSTLPVISAVVEQYRVTADGLRFLFCMPLTSVQQEPLRVIVNWTEIAGGS
jgi:eukaryotic-like serine/threonine-protein kinase